MVGTGMSQRNLVLRLLREAGPEGVDNHALVYVFGVTRAASIVHGLRIDGHPVDTIDRGFAPDGKRRLCTYVLRGAQPSQVAPAIPSEPGAPAPELPLPCGCIRAAGGMAWKSRCERHDPVEAI